jgi:outer membrane lipoprotein-sorting protein
MIPVRRSVAFLAILALLFPVLAVSPACAQTRLSDKDLEQRIKNMNSDIKQFRSMFNSSVAKSSIRKTTQE